MTANQITYPSGSSIPPQNDDPLNDPIVFRDGNWIPRRLGWVHEIDQKGRIISSTPIRR